MLTFENVLEMFSEYIQADRDLEVKHDRHGYTLMLWDNTQESWSEVNFCPTPGKMFEYLLNLYYTYRGLEFVEDHGSLTEEDEAQLREWCLPFLNKREELEKNR